MLTSLVCLALNLSLLEDRPMTTQTALALNTYGIKLNVDDMDKALSFYCDKLGFEVKDRSNYPQEVALESGEETQIILAKVQKLRETKPTDTRVSFTLQVNDLDQAIEHMKGKGIPFAEQERRKEGVGYAITILDPFGRRISLMHQTIVKVDPFAEPKIYNYGFTVPDMDKARDFYSKKLGFIELTDRYLPRDMPLGNPDKSFGFMLHAREGISQVVIEAASSAHCTVMFQTHDLALAREQLRELNVQITDSSSRSVSFADPFGNECEVVRAEK